MTRTLSDLQVDVESTFVLLDLVRAGDTRALDRLFARYVMPLQRFAHGRLPMNADDLAALYEFLHSLQPQSGPTGDPRFRKAG